MTLWRGALVAVGVYELLAWWQRRALRTSRYAAAQDRASALGRQFVVVGDPDGGPTAGYGYGDFCLDLTGCPKAPCGLAVDVTKPLPFHDDSVVVFVSCTLEYVDNLAAAWAELRRVAGSVNNLFVVAVQPATLTSFFYPGAKWRILAAPPDAQQLVAVDLRGTNRVELAGWRR